MEFMSRKSLEEKFKKTVEKAKIPEGFIKVTDSPVKGLSSEQKVILNRKANITLGLALGFSCAA